MQRDGAVATCKNSFDYHYSDAELRQWIDLYINPMAGRARSGIIFLTTTSGARHPTTHGT